MHRTSIRIALTVIAGLIIACALGLNPRLLTGSALSSVPLTKEDVISIYDVPVDKQPASKFQWDFAGQRYVRAIVERRDQPGEPWHEVGAYPWNSPVSQAVFIYQLNRTDWPDRSGEYPWRLSLRIGGSRGHLFVTHGWSGSALLLPMPAPTYNSESHFTDPDRVLAIHSGTRDYRVRLESSFVPFK